MTLKDRIRYILILAKAYRYRMLSDLHFQVNNGLYAIEHPLRRITGKFPRKLQHVAFAICKRLIFIGMSEVEKARTNNEKFGSILQMMIEELEGT